MESIKIPYHSTPFSLIPPIQTHPRCSSAISFPGGYLPASLKSLYIWDCKKLEFPKQKHELLGSLNISRSCDSLTSFPLEAFPNLETLLIRECENLESLSFSLSQSQHNALDNLHIWECPNFVSFPREGLPAPRMTCFKVWGCNKLKSLPCDMNTLLPKLESLEIKDCPEIDSFPVGGLTTSLKKLRIDNSEKLLSNLSSMGVHEGLTDLYIYGPCVNVKSFPKEGSPPHLPSLTILLLDGLSSVETLECKELLHLSSLQRLLLLDCTKLENMAGERLPASLIELDVSCSPLLIEQCEKKHPQIWPKISHIREIVLYEESFWS